MQNCVALGGLNLSQLGGQLPAPCEVLHRLSALSVHLHGSRRPMRHPPILNSYKTLQHVIDELIQIHHITENVADIIYYVRPFWLWDLKG